MNERKLQERHHRLTRRRFTTGLCLGLVTAFSGCGGSVEGTPASATPDSAPSPVTPSPMATVGPGTGTPAGTGAPPAAAPSTTSITTAAPADTAPTTASTAAPTWTVADSGALALEAGATFDLTATLPAGVARGGVFELDASGAALPAGIALLPAGVLAVSGSATGTTSGVVFRYTPPA